MITTCDDAAGTLQFTTQNNAGKTGNISTHTE